MNSDKFFFNRELSWLSFNHRVLQEAANPSVPLMERIKFLAIFSSNLDEFFRVRVASLRSLLRLKKKKISKLTFDPEQLLKQVHKVVNKQQEQFGKIFREQIIPGLATENIFLVNSSSLNDEQTSFLREYYLSQLQIHLQPVLLDKNKIATFLNTGKIYLSVRLKSRPRRQSTSSKKSYKYALVEIPSDKLARFIILPLNEERREIIFIDDIVKLFLPELFPGYDIDSSYSVKLTRDAELYIDDEFSGNLLDKIKKGLYKRSAGVPSRFLYDSRMPASFLKILQQSLGLNKDDLIAGGAYHNFNDLFSFPELTSAACKYSKMLPLPSPHFNPSKSIFEIISEKDVMVHYPYNSFEPVIRFLNEAAVNKNVISIKITLYRVAGNSEIVKALCLAAKQGKSVTAFVEVKARFDEEMNFSSADELVRSGVKVLYSIPGIKVHSKMCIVELSEDSVSEAYAYFATGNFNEKTAKVYSDLGLFTANSDMIREAQKIFEFLDNKNEPGASKHLMAAPWNLRTQLEELIDESIDCSSKGNKAKIILKLNSLEDKKMIKKLYQASEAGVKIFIIVRGICCLVPGIKGLSSNIKVISIVDRYLEHARVFIFRNGRNEKIFVSSADLMTRNLNRRVEVCFPIYDSEVRKFINEIIDIQMKDGAKARNINRYQNNQYRKTRYNIRAQYSTYDYIKGLSENNLP